ncbi:MAG TPA: glycosyltransferase, partial [Polyangia bacterium]|nr:glycosyltransferase [Polyangia bacterium]
MHLAVYTDATRIAGAEQFAATLVGELSADLRVTVAGVDAGVVAWIAGHRAGAETAVLAPVRDKRDARPIVEHARWVHRARPDVLQANLRHSYACQFAIAPGLLVPGVRVVAVEHFPTPPASRLQLALKRLTSRRLAAHVAVSDSSARTVEAIVGLPAGRVRTIHAGVPAAPNPAAAADAAVGDPGGAPVVGAVGRFVAEKGFDVL